MNMKKLLTLIFRLLLPRLKNDDQTDDKLFEHLDGAEFYVVIPPMQPQTSVD